MTVEIVAPGVWKISLGTPEPLTPLGLRHTAPLTGAMETLSVPAECPIDTEKVTGFAMTRGYQVGIPLGEGEAIYGLGLQLTSFNQRGKKKTLRVNSDPTIDLGDSHAPVPFYVTSEGYGVLVDTARYPTYYMGTAKRLDTNPVAPEANTSGESLAINEDNRPEYFGQKSGAVDIDIPAAAGVDVYIFAGPTMLDAVRRYNLFSGGGALVPRWGLGVWYRPDSKMTGVEVDALAMELRESKMPCDVIGLEPGWQSRSYSCSYVWSDGFPDPKTFISGLRKEGFQVNLWTHAFTNPASPIYEKLIPLAGDHQIWRGLIPDLTLPQAREIYAGLHEELHVDAGVSGYKLDECDDSDFLEFGWSFPLHTQFPSGLDGEQFHSVFGMNYMETLGGIFPKRDLRTYGLVRNAHALASSYPFVLYSDLYKHDDFLRGLVNAGFSGLLWTPEVRDAQSETDLIRRLQSVVLSPMALINAWYIRLPPWKQWRTHENNAGNLLEDYVKLQDSCREILNLRMKFVPYLYAAFDTYRKTGTPPFRALVMDYPGDRATHEIDNQYMMGDRVMVAPLTAEMSERDVYIPEGNWRDFWTGDLIEGGKPHKVIGQIERIPVYVKDGTILPLATPTQNVEDPASFDLTVHVYGDGSLPATLIEDDGVTLATVRGEFNVVTLTLDGSTIALSRVGDFTGQTYRAISVVRH